MVWSTAGSMSDRLLSDNVRVSLFSRIFFRRMNFDLVKGLSQIDQTQSVEL